MIDRLVPIDVEICIPLLRLAFPVESAYAFVRFVVGKIEGQHSVDGKRQRLLVAYVASVHHELSF